MIGRLPISARALSTHGTRQPTWDEARRRLDEAQFYWLATVRPDGHPHLVPLLAVWCDDALHIVAGPATRKARNLADEPRCAIAVDSDDLHLVVEGEAARIEDAATLRRLAAAYASKYRWEVAVRDGAFYGEGAPTAGPPPYAVYAVRILQVFAFGTDDAYGAVRWRLTPR